MASEIRDLEDEIYTYDSEYRILEQELESLKSENARLRGGTSGGFSSGSAAGKPGIRLGAPKELPWSPSQPNYHGSDSNIEHITPSDDPVFVPSPAPALDKSAKPIAPKGPSANSPAPSNQPAPPSGLPVPKDVPGATSPGPFDFKNLTPPNVEQGEPMPPLLQPPKLDPSTPLSASTQNELEIQVSQIPLPARLASSPLNGSPTGTSTGSPPSSLSNQSGGPARLLPAMEMPKDTRIVELKFHSGLCRAMNFDAQGDDDGLYLVLQPMNAAGQFVPVAADLVIAVIDPSKNDTTGRIGKWSYSTADVENKLQPIGNSQGIHLSLPWNGPDPGADRVIVFAYYTLDDGRRLVSETEIFVNNAHRQSTVWVPRSKPISSDGNPGKLPGGEVRTASGERAAR